MLAAGTTNNSGGSAGFLIVAIAAIAIFSIFVRRANAKRAGAATSIQSAAVIGSEVMTGSGIYGTVVGQDDEQVLLEIAPGVQVRFAKAAIARVITPDDESELADLGPAGDLGASREPVTDDLDEHGAELHDPEAHDPPDAPSGPHGDGQH